MNKALVASIAAFVFLASCVSSPPPAQPTSGSQEATAPSAEQSRARDLVTGGADAGSPVASAPAVTSTVPAAG